MNALILLAVGFMLAGPVMAGDDDAMSRPARSESLELPGLTAGCHVCEWRPKLNNRPAVSECGMDAAGQARIGVFECGFSEDCKRVCHFVSCAQL